MHEKMQEFKKMHVLAHSYLSMRMGKDMLFYSELPAQICMRYVTVKEKKVKLTDCREDIFFSSFMLTFFCKILVSRGRAM